MRHSTHRGAGVKIEQGYLARGQEATARVRTFGAKGFLTIKGKTTGISRQEFEYEIPLEDAQALLTLCEGGIIRKRRWLVEIESHIWEVDRFEGDNAGLIVAEIELQTEKSYLPNQNGLVQKSVMIHAISMVRFHAILTKLGLHDSSSKACGLKQIKDSSNHCLIRLSRCG